MEEPPATPTSPRPESSATGIHTLKFMRQIIKYT